MKSVRTWTTRPFAADGDGQSEFLVGSADGLVRVVHTAPVATAAVDHATRTAEAYACSHSRSPCAADGTTAVRRAHEERRGRFHDVAHDGRHRDGRRLLGHPARRMDAVLVGDSLSMVVQGHENTLHVTLDEILYHAEMVGRAVHRALVVVDMPFPTFHLGCAAAVASAARILKETRCQAVKLEGGVEQAATIAALVAAGIPVMGHVGLRPQTVHQMGGYKVQRDEERLLADALAAEQAGAFAIVLECIPPPIAARLTESLHIPTIGIGAGAACDGQVLVLHDLLGLTSGYVPSFVRQYADLRTIISRAVQEYCRDLAAGTFPDPGQAAK